MKKPFPSTVFIVIAALAQLSATGGALASDQFSADTVDFSGFKGRITIERHAAKDIAVSLKRGEAQALRLNVERGVLFIVYEQKATAESGFTGTISHFNIGANATQEIIIGNKRITGGKVQETPEVLVQAPASVALVSTAFVGEAFIDAMSGPALLSVSEGRIYAKRLGPARLGIKGAGDIELDEATREVRMSIDGAGDIVVRGGKVDNVWADANGAGSIKYTGGHIKQAFVSAKGASTITLDGVDQVRRGPVEGASELEINPSRR